jgi:hypothetical protein
VIDAATRRLCYHVRIKTDNDALKITSRILRRIEKAALPLEGVLAKQPLTGRGGSEADALAYAARRLAQRYGQVRLAPPELRMKQELARVRV